MCYLYILKSSKDNKLYVGVTKNLQKRIKQHNSGSVRSTKSRKPLILIYNEKFSNLSEARKKEWELKYTPWGGKLKKQLAEKWSLGPTKSDRDGGQQS